MSAASRAIAAAAKAAQRVAGVDVLYGGFPIRAVPGSTTYLSTDANGIQIVCQARDWLVLEEDLKVALAGRDPADGDKIVQTLEDATQQTFEVGQLPTEPCWRWNDPHRIRRRIHSKEVSNS